jgi:PAS domain S-box-containing protein
MASDTEKFMVRVKYLYEHKEEKCGEEVFLKDGRVVERYSSPVRRDGGEYLGRIWYFRDITERKRMEEALKESEERYRALVELSPDAIYILTGGKLIFANSQGAKVLGVKRVEDIYGRKMLDFVHPDCLEFVKQRIVQAFQTGEPTPPGEQIFVRVDGSQVPVEVTSVPFRYQGENALLAIAHDITDRRRMQEELLKGQKLESLGLLAGGIAHDFNNILTGIVGNLSIAKLQIDPSHKIVNRLELYEKAAIQATELTRQLLTFARGGEPVKKIINPSSLIRETVSFALRGSNIRGIIDIQDSIWSMEADESQLSQVLNNLLLNAEQAMPTGGEVTIRVENETLLHDNPQQLPPGDYIRIAVEDSGCGIPHENLVRVFDPYFTTKPKGSGLGLASVYSIIKKHGGAVEVSSTKGVGTAFNIHIPAVPDKLPEDAALNESEELRGSGRVLVMDDEYFIREIATYILEFMGYEVDCCVGGEEAVECFQAARKNNVPYSAVILDLTIPGGMGGKDAAARILEIDPDAVLIVSSGYSSDPVIANFHQYGFSGVVSKPFDTEGLARELKRLIPNNC